MIENRLEEALEHASDRLSRGEAVSREEDLELKIEIAKQLAGIGDVLSLIAQRLERLEKWSSEVERELDAYKRRYKESGVEHVIARKLEEVDEIPEEVRAQAKARLSDDVQRTITHQRANALANGLTLKANTEKHDIVDFEWRWETTYFVFGDVAFVVRPGMNSIPRVYWGEIQRNIENRERLERRKAALNAERQTKRWDDVKDIVLGR